MAMGGGSIKVYPRGQIAKIHPQFNTLHMWPLGTNGLIMHLEMNFFLLWKICTT